MTRAMGILCAALVIGSAGCALNFGNTRVDVAVKVDEQAIESSLDDAVAKLQAELHRRGIQTTVSPDGDTVRVVCVTKTNDKFTVVLRRVPVLSKVPVNQRKEAGFPDHETQVRVEWEKAPDGELWLGLVAALGTAAVSPAH